MYFLNLKPSPNLNVTQIHCGTSSPKLSGSINLSLFPNITDFTCTNNDITKIIGYENNPNLININFSQNKIIGSIPNLNNNTQLRTFYCPVNELTGSIPTLSSNTQLRDFRCHLNQLTGTIPAINTNSFLVEFNCSSNQLTGQIPSPYNLLNFTNYYCFSNQLTGQIPTLNNNIQRFDCNNNQLTGQIPNLNSLGILRVFVCRSNQISGTIPSLSNNDQLIDFQCQSNLLIEFAGGSVSINLGNFQAQNNQLSAAAVNAILAAFVAANRTSGTRILNLGGTGNAAPTGQGLVDKQTLINRGWTVTTN
jgi:hypothetical protein